MPRWIDLPCETVVAEYRAGQSTITLARRYGCSPTTVAKRLRACGVAVRDARFPAIYIAEALLRRLYLDERLPISAIAAYFGVSASTIGNKRRAYNIPIRPRQNAPADREAAQLEQSLGLRAHRVLHEAIQRYVYSFIPG